MHRCPVDAVLEVIGGKWKMLLVWTLVQRPHRYGALRRALPHISEKMLIQQLRQLEADGLVHREQFPEVPPRVEYSLTARGRTLTPILSQLSDWGRTHLADRLAPASPDARREQAQA